MAYYSLIAREMHNGKLSPWGVQFGDYDRNVVKAEMDDYFESDCQFAQMKIIQTNIASQSEIDKALAELNDDNGMAEERRKHP